MREQALRARPRRRGQPSDKGIRHEAADNVLDRQFKATAPNQKWVADFTYIWTAEGWLYVAAVIDLFSRRVVGWSMSAAMAAQLVADALMMAIWRRGKPGALLHHSDQGSQYRSEQFQKLLADHGVICSMSRSGNVWDNAAMESFFSSLKTERTAARCIAPGTRPGLTCSTTSKGSTTRADATRPSAISAIWSSSGSKRQLKLRVHETGSSSVMSDETKQAPKVDEAMVDPAVDELAEEDIVEVAGGRSNPQPIPPG